MKFSFLLVPPLVEVRANAKHAPWNPKLAFDDLVKFCACLEKAGIVYWLTYGTLLGLVRDGALIAWDHDVDIALAPGTDFALLDQATSHAGVGIVQTVRFQENVVVAKAVSGGTSVDLFFLSDVGGKTIDYGGQSTHLTLYSHLKERPEWRGFGGAKLAVPENAEAYLAHIYGPNWRMPQSVWSWKYSNYNIEEVIFTSLSGIWFYGAGWLRWQAKRLRQLVHKWILAKV